MKREKIYCLASAFVMSILLMILTLKFTSMDFEEIIIVYFALTFAVVISILAGIKNKQSKSYQYEVLATIDALVIVLSFIFAIFGIIQPIKNTAYIVFLLTFIMLPFLCGLWSKYEKIQK